MIHTANNNNTMSAQQTMNDVTNHANIEEEEPQEDLPSVFERAVSLWKSIEEGNVENETDAAKTCSALMRLCQRRVEKADFFSHNETVEDVQTHCLKYVLCYHYTGLALLRATVDPTERLHYLRDAKTLLNRFLQRCEQLELVTENEKKLIYESDSLDSTQLRQYKIQRHKEEKEARETLKVSAEVSQIIWREVFFISSRCFILTAPVVGRQNER